jgi:hypothetical protein
MMPTIDRPIRMKRPMKTFEADTAMFKLLEAVSDYRTAACGSSVAQSQVIRDAIVRHAINDALASGPADLEKHLASMRESTAPFRHAEEETRIRAAHAYELGNLLRVCEAFGLDYDKTLVPGTPKGKGKK